MFCEPGRAGLQLARDPPRLQRLWLSIQATVEHYEGHIVQFLVDDKGTTLIVAFGLPRFRTKTIRGAWSTPARPCWPSWRRRRAGAAGITTGRAFCGGVAISPVAVRGRRRWSTPRRDSCKRRWPPDRQRCSCAMRSRRRPWGADWFDRAAADSAQRPLTQQLAIYSPTRAQPAAYLGRLGALPRHSSVATTRHSGNSHLAAPAPSSKSRADPSKARRASARPACRSL